MEILKSYINGNTKVTLYKDGTRIREFEDKNNIKVDFPSSIDVKITNKCTGKVTCRKFCHEKSNPMGEHGDLDKLLDVLKELPSGVECAFGGGKPTCHPNLISFLQKLKIQGLISNLTTNQQHLKEDKDLLIKLINEKLIYGLGISYSSKQLLENIVPIIKETDNLVFHVIMGVNSVDDVNELLKFCQENNKICKILVLGYKQYGMGINYYLKNKNIEANKYQWYTQLARYFKTKDLILSFDNLAIEQLKLKRYFTDEAWEKFFQGKDGQFTMYIDSVKQEFAKSSTSSDRKSFQDYSLLSYFNKYKNV